MQPDNALFGCRMLSSFISVVSAFIGDRLQRRHRGDRGLASKRLKINTSRVYPSYFKFHVRWRQVTRPIQGLAPSGLAQALFKTVNYFILQLELFRDMPGGINHNQYHQMLFNHIGRILSLPHRLIPDPIRAVPARHNSHFPVDNRGYKVPE